MEYVFRPYGSTVFVCNSAVASVFSPRAGTSVFIHLAFTFSLSNCCSVVYWISRQGTTDLLMPVLASFDLKDVVAELAR
jgi:hypothetical protein